MACIYKYNGKEFRTEESLLSYLRALRDDKKASNDLPASNPVNNQGGGQTMSGISTFTFSKQRQAIDDFESLMDELIKIQANSHQLDLEHPEVVTADDLNKIDYSYNAFAYLSRDYRFSLLANGKFAVQLADESNELSEALRDKKLLSPDHYLPGTKITLTIDKNFNENGETYLTRLRQGEAEEAIREKKEGESPYENRTFDYIPIAITTEGGSEPVAYFHDASYPNARTKSANIEEDISNIRAIRNALMTEYNGSFDTTITEKRIGTLATTFDNSSLPVNEALKDPNLVIGTFGNNGIQASKKIADNTINSHKLKAGVSYAFLKATKDKYVAVPLLSTKLRENHVNSILSALEIYLNGDITSATSKRMFEAGYNVATEAGMMKYIRAFTGLVNLDKGVTLRNRVLNSNDANAYISMGNEFIDASYGGGSGYTSTFLSKTGERLYVKGMGLTPDLLAKERLAEFQAQEQREPTQEELDAILKQVEIDATTNELREYISKEEFLKRMGTILADTYYHVNAEKVETGEGNIPTITQEGEVNVASKEYLNFIKDTHVTNVIDFDLGDGEYTAFIQPTIKFGTPKLAHAQVVKGADTIIITDSDEEVKENKTVFGDLSDLMSAKTKMEEDSATPISKKEIIQKVTTSMEPFRLEGYTAGQQETIISNFTNRVLEILITEKKVGEKLAMISAMDEIRGQFEVDFKTSIRATAIPDAKKADIVANIDNVVRQWRKVERLVVDRLSRLSLAKVNVPLSDMEIEEGLSVDSIDNPADYDGYHERLNYNETSLEVDPKDTVSARLKSFLIGITELIVDKEKSTRDNTVWKPARDSKTALVKYVPYDKIFADLMGINAGSKPSFDEIYNRIKKASKKKRYLKGVLEKLDAATDQVKTEFVVQLSKHQIMMKTLLIDFDAEKDTYAFKIRDTNSTAFKNTIKNEWRGTLDSRSGFKIDGSTYFPEAQREQILRDYRIIKHHISFKRPQANDDGISDWFEDAIEGVSAWLDNFGIEIPEDALAEKIIDKDKWNSFVYPGSGPLEVLANNITYRKNATLEQRDLFDDNAITALAGLANQFRNDIYAQSFRNGELKSIYNYSNNKEFIDTYFDLLNDANKRNDLLKNPFNRNSQWLKNLNEENHPLRDVFKYFYFDTLQAVGKKGTASRRLNAASMEVVALNMFANRGNARYKDKKQRTVNLFHPTMAGRKNLLGVTTFGYLTQLEQGETEITDEMADIYIDQVIRPEVERIYELGDADVNIVGFNIAKKLFLLTPQLNYDQISDELKPIWYKGGKHIKKPKTVLEKYKEPLRRFVKDFINSEKDAKLKEWERFGIINVAGDTVVNKYIDDMYISKIVKPQLTVGASDSRVANYTAFDFVFNTLVGNANFYQTFVGDPALLIGDINENNSVDTALSAANAMAKRLAMAASPGVFTALEGNYTEGVLDDRYADSLLEEVRKIHPKYSGMQSTDSAEYTTFDEHLTILVGLGRISKEQKAKYLKAETLTPLDLDTILDLDSLLVAKPVVSVRLQDDEYNTERILRLKTASLPLIPQLTKGFEIDKLRVAMEKQKISRVTFATAVKAGDKIRLTSDAKKKGYTKQLFNSDGTIKDKIVFNKSNTFIIPRTAFRIQQEAKPQSKTLINDGTQQRKFTFLDLLHNNKGFRGLEQEYRELYNESFALKGEELDTALRDENGMPNFRAIRQILLDESRDRSYDINDRILLNMSEEDFKTYVVMSQSSTRMEATLNSLYDNRVRKNKVPGFSSALTPEEGWLIKDYDKLADKEKILGGIIPTSNFTGRLLPQRVEKGKVLPAQVFVPWNLMDSDGTQLAIEDFIGDDGKIDMTLLPQEVLRGMAYRIPTSSQSSMTNYEIVGFINEGVSKVIIAPRDLITQMGLDFDYDQLYLRQYNLTKNVKGFVTKYTGEDRLQQIQNRLLEIQEEVFSNTKARDRITSPIGYGNLEDIAKQLDIITLNNNSNFTPLNSSYQRELYVNSAKAQEGVGVFSILTTLISNAQSVSSTGKAVYFQDDKGTPIPIKFGNQGSSILGAPTGAKDNRKLYKSDVASAFQNVMLDDDKLQIAGKLNINEHTFRVINSLIFSGFDDQLIEYFINQPIIRDYVEKIDFIKNDVDTVDYRPESTAEHLISIDPKWMSEEFEGLSLREMWAEMDKSGKEDLRLMLSDPNPNVITQRALLEKFIKITELGKRLVKLNSAIHTEASGIPKFLAHSLLKEVEINELVDVGISNAEAFVGEYIIDSFNNVTDIVPTTINGAAIVHALKPNNRMWSNYFPYGQAVPKSIFTRLEGISNIGFQSSEARGSWRYKTFKNLVTYIQSTNYGEDNRKRLFTTNNSLAHTLKKVKLYGRLADNPFINVLQAFISKQEQQFSTVGFNNASEAETLETNIHAGFTDLLQDDSPLFNSNPDYTVSDFGEDLALAALLQGNHVASSYRRFVPIAYQQAIMGDVFDNINFQDEQTINATNFARQQLQHTPWIVKSIDPTHFISEKGGYSPSEMFISINDGDEAGYIQSRNGQPFLLPYLSFKNNTGWHLYALSNSIEKRYVKIPVIGSFGVDEFNPSLAIGTSVLPGRNDNTNTDPSLLEDDFLEIYSPRLSTALAEAGDVSGTNNDPLFQGEVMMAGVNNAYQLLEKIGTDDEIPLYQYLADLYKDKDVAVVGPNNTNAKGRLTQIEVEVKDLVIDGVPADAAWSTKDGKLYVDRELLKKNKATVYQVLMHEYTHAVTLAAIDADPDITATVNRYIERALPTLQAANFVRTAEYLGKNGAHEFIADVMTNKELQKLLASVKLTEEEFQESGRSLTNILQKIFRYLARKVREFINVDTEVENSLLQVALEEAMYIMGEHTKLMQDVARLKGRDLLHAKKRQDETKGNSRYEIVARDREIRIKDLYRALTNIQNQPGNAVRVTDMKKRIKDYETEISGIRESQSLEEIKQYADKDILRLVSIFSEPRIQITDVYEARRIIELWKQSFEILFTDMQNETRTKISDAFAVVKRTMEQYEHKLIPAEEEVLERFLRKEGVDVPITEILKKAKDVNFMAGHTLSIDRFNNAMLSVLQKTMWDTGVHINQDLLDFQEEFGKISKDTIAELKRLGYKDDNLWELFKQMDNGKFTGNMTYRLVQDFFDTRSRELFRAQKTKDWKRYYAWKADNELVFDIRRLFRPEAFFEEDDAKLHKTKATYDENSPEILEHKKEIIAAVGEGEFERLMKVQELKLNRYKERFLHNKIAIESQYDPDTARDVLNTWIQENSPYLYSESVYTSKYRVSKEYKGREYEVATTRKDKWTDENFKKIAANEKLLKFYEYYVTKVSEIRRLLPRHATEHMSVNAVPFLEKTLGQQFNQEGGMQAGLSGIWDNMKKAISTKETNPTYVSTDPVTKKELMGVSSKIKFDNELINKLVDKAVLEHEISFGRPPTAKEVADFRQDAQDIIARDKSFDLEKALVHMYNVGVTYKHKALMEDQIRLSSTIMSRAREFRFDTHNNPIRDTKGEAQYKDDGSDFKTQKEALNHSIRSFYGLPQKQLLVSKQKVYSKEDKEEKKALEELLVKAKQSLSEKTIEQERYDELEEEIQQKISNLGRNVAGSRIVRSLMKFVQFKGMGWNWFSGFNNVGFGVFSNFTLASDGRVYDMKNLKKGYSIVFENFLRNNTLGVYNSSNAKKVKALVDKFGLERIMLDFTKLNPTKGTGVLERLSPYSIQKHTEFLNYAPLMVAILDKNDAWEKYNEKGKWIGEKGAEPDLAATIISTVIANHGNYNPDSALLLDKNIIGQAFAQFRRWAFEAFAQRFEGEKTDHIRGIERKGRYRSSIGTFTFAQTKEGVADMGIVERNLYTLTQLARKLMWMPTKFDDKFNKVDAANLRANLTELMFLGTMLMVTSMLKHFAKGEDDDDDKFVYYTLINMFTRMQMDLTFYINPFEAEALMRRPLPVTSVVVDSYEFIDAAVRYTMGDDIIKSGIYANDSRLARETFQLFPFTSQIYRSISSGKMLYNK